MLRREGHLSHADRALPPLTLVLVSQTWSAQNRRSALPAHVAKAAARAICSAKTELPIAVVRARCGARFGAGTAGGPLILSLARSSRRNMKYQPFAVCTRGPSSLAAREREAKADIAGNRRA